MPNFKLLTKFDPLQLEENPFGEHPNEKKYLKFFAMNSYLMWHGHEHVDLDAVSRFQIVNYYLGLRIFANGKEYFQKEHEFHSYEFLELYFPDGVTKLYLKDETLSAWVSEIEN